MRHERLSSTAALGAVGAALVALLASSGQGATPAAGAGSNDRCHPDGTRLVLDRPVMAVFSRATRAGPREYACPKPRGGLLALAESGGGERDVPFAPPALRITGRAVGWAVNVRNESPGPAEGGRETLVRRGRYYRPGENPNVKGWFTTLAVRAGYAANARVGSLVVRQSLSVAWIACPPRRKHGRETCRKRGHRDTVYLIEHSFTQRKRIAQSKRIDPRSLRRNGDRIVWTEAGHRRSAPFPP